MRKVTSITILIIIFVETVTQFSSLAETVNAAGGNAPDFEAIAAILSQIESGRTALAQMEQYDVEVKFEAGGGTYYQASNNRMVIDGSHGIQRAALSFVHEMTHARYHNEERRVDIGEADQELYIQGRIEEEAEGVVRSIVAKNELAEAGFDVSQLRYPLEKAYTEAYLTAQNAARARERDITSAELNSIGQAAGIARVIQGLVNGEVLDSKRLSVYTDTYGDCWGTADTLADLVAVVSKVISAEAAAELLQSTNDYVSGTC
jgi:hypothetical protein